MKLLVQGASGIEDVPGLDGLTSQVDLVFAADDQQLSKHLPGTEILLGWNFRGRQLADCWNLADRLKWIHWCGAGVDAALFPELAASDIVLTNSRGVFDRAMAEYVLGYMLYEMKLFAQTGQHQEQQVWQHRFSGKLAGQSAVIFGVGSIGREIAKMLKAMGVQVSGVGRSARAGDDCFDTIYAAGDGANIAGNADWVIGVMPGTAQTAGYFSASFFSAMKPTARFINIGRGSAVDEAALLAALTDATIAGAMLDVFAIEPLPPESPMWSAPNLFVSPHLCGDYHDYEVDIANMFLENLKRYRAGHRLKNVVDKKLGFVAS